MQHQPVFKLHPVWLPVEPPLLCGYERMKKCVGVALGGEIGGMWLDITPYIHIILLS